MSGRRTIAATLSMATEAVGVYLKHALVEPFKSAPGLPRAMHYLSTHRCNARCVMCGIWREGDTSQEDLSPGELAGILADRLFSRMEFDLIPLLETFLTGCPRIKRLSLTTNGLIPQRIETVLPQLAERARDAGVLFDICVSVHGIGETLARIYGVPRAFEKLERSVRVLEELRKRGRLTFSFNCVLLAENLDAVGELRRWASERKIPVAFVVGEQRDRFRTGGLQGSFVGLDRRPELVAFLRSVADDPDQSAPSSVKYRELADILEGRATRRLSCYYAMGGLLLGHDGTLYYCPHSDAVGSCRDRQPHAAFFDPDSLRYRRSEILGVRCLRCPPYTRTRWEIEKDLPRMAFAALRRRLSRNGHPRRP